MGAKTLDLGAWFILRMNSADTVSTFDGLKRMGFNVWTPIEQRVCRTPRRRVQYDRRTALMPSYVFASADHLDELLQAAMSPSRELPRFTVFTHKGGIPMVADVELNALRYAEEKADTLFAKMKRLGRKGPKLGKGSEVHLTEGPFAGMSGIVEGQSGQFTLVSFDGFHKPIQIASLLLVDEQAQAKAA